MVAPATILEVCCDTLAGVRTATFCSADRIGLCASLREGGLTPSVGAVDVACAMHPAVVVLVRPRAGDFVYGADDRAAMERDVETLVGDFGSADEAIVGLAVGALYSDATIDVDVVRALVTRARDIPVTFHRAFDSVPNPHEALEALAELGIQRVLTAGQAERAIDAIDRLAELHAAAERLGITILAAGGVRSDHVRELVDRTGVREVHSSARVASSAEPGSGLHAAVGVVDASEVRRLRAALDDRRVDRS